MKKKKFLLCWNISFKVLFLLIAPTFENVLFASWLSPIMSSWIVSQEKIFKNVPSAQIQGSWKCLDPCRLWHWVSQHCEHPRCQLGTGRSARQWGALCAQGHRQISTATGNHLNNQASASHWLDGQAGSSPLPPWWPQLQNSCCPLHRDRVYQQSLCQQYKYLLLEASLYAAYYRFHWFTQEIFMESVTF